MFFPSGLRHRRRNFDLYDECFCFLPDPFPQAILPIQHISLWLQRVTEWPFQDFCCVTVPRSIYIFNPCIWPLSRFPQKRPTLLLPPDFSQCSCVKSEAEGGQQIMEMGRPHGTLQSWVFDLCDSPFSSKGSALWDRDRSYIPQTQGTLHTFKRCAKKRLSLLRHSPQPLLSKHMSQVLGKCLWSSN